MAIEFHCSKCGKFLSTDESKAGRQAKCPGCGELITVPQSSTAESAGDAGEATPVAKPARPPRPCPMCGAEVPAGARACPACGEELSAVKTGPAIGGQIKIEVGDVFSTAWEITKRNLGFLVAVIIVSFVAGLLFGIPASFVSSVAQMQQQNGQHGVALGLFLFSLFWQILAAVFGVFLACGQTMIQLKLARGEQAELGELFRGMRFLLRMVMCNVVLFFLGVACFVPFLITVLVSRDIAPFVALASFVVVIYFSIAFEPFPFVLVAEDTPGIAAISRAWQLTNGNRLTLLLLAIVQVLVLVLGVLACCVGLLVAWPFVSMMLTVAYLRMSGQPTVLETEAA